MSTQIISDNGHSRQDEHRAKYEAIAQQIGVELIKELILSSISKAQIVRGLQRDRNLNVIPLRRWDNLHWAMTHLARLAGITDWPPFMTVCTAKHVATYHIAGWTAEQHDNGPTP